MGQGLRIVGASQSHPDTPYSVELPWTSDLPAQQTLPDNVQHTKETEIHNPGGIQTRNVSRQAAAKPRPRPRGHWDRL